MPRNVVLALACILAFGCGQHDDSPGTGPSQLNVNAFPPWSMAGTGNNVFDKPSYVARVRIVGRYSGFSQNFIVWCRPNLLVNEILGTGWPSTAYDGVHRVDNCPTIEVANSTGVTWTVSEAR